ncbi:MAG: hypothetical protein K2H04_09030 [Bacteroidaceae bacterium]|nr:hypothetical protein [Bacteroidaceae bacterium]
MELPANLLGSAVGEGDIYLFNSDCPVGIANHMHICIKHADKVIFLSTCSSQISTAMRIAMLRGYDMNTFPVFISTKENKFRKPQTYVNCNKVVELADEEFGTLVKSGRICKLEGNIGTLGLSLIAKGIKLSPDIEGRIKRLF